jgi:uncharacterized Fe-S radical SAM superfamily protein PflX
MTIFSRSHSFLRGEILFVPSYIEAHKTGKLSDSIEKAYKILENCRLCPRECEVNRLEDEKGICHTGRSAIVSSCNPHFGEEDPLAGTGGSGTREIMRFIVKDISPDTYVNIMDQYRPCGNADKYPPLDHRITHDEYEEALRTAREEGITMLDKRERWIRTHRAR